ncbi:phage tail protein [Micromonospora tulbaghiae]|uniref:phage tail protein n=1 Tax=Micromonospora tulbaghiae TaxID=479978 RepID=UPI0033F7B8C2
MTSPVIVGQVGVEVSASARGFARRLREAVVSEFKSAGLDKALQDALGKRKIKIPVEPDWDASKMAAGRPDAKIPVQADTSGMRARVAAEVAQIGRTVRAEIPTEPGSRSAYEARLRATVVAASRSVRATIPVEVDHNRFQRSVSSLAARLPQAFAGPVQRVGAAFNSLGQSALTTGGQLAAGLTSVVNPATMAAVAIGGTVLAFLTIGPAASAAAAAIGVVVGALGALPAGFVGLGATVATFGLALKGIGERFKETAKGAGGAGQSAAAAGRQIAAAQRGVAQAQRGLAAAERNYSNALGESLRAQRAINDARRVAARRIEDLGRALRGAALDERDAALRVEEAMVAMSEAWRSGDPLAIRRASLDLEQAQFAAEEAALATKDAAAAKADADRKGIEGSDEVVAALDRQRAANDALLSAADGLKSAQEGLVAANESLAAAQEKTGASAGGVAKELTKLSPAAQSFVNAVKSLKPAFESLRLDVQERAFKGLDKTVRQVGNAWLPQLRTTLGSYADTFNGFFRDLGKNISQPEFIKNIGAGAESIRGLLEKVGKEVSGPFVDAFGRLSRAAKPFIDALGDELSDLIKDFSAWITSADKSGKLENFFEKAGDFLRDVFDIGRSVASIFKSITEILFGADAGKGSGMKETFENIATFLKDPENQRRIAVWLASLKEFGRILIVDVIPAVTGFLFWLTGLVDKISGAYESVKGFFEGIGETVDGWASAVGGTLSGLPDKIGGWLSGIPDKVSGFFSSATQRVTTTVGGWLTSLSTQFTSVRTRVTTALSNVPNQLFGLFQSAVNRAANVLSTLAGRAGTAASNTASRIRSALANVGRDMYQAGRNVVFGLWDGIGSLGNWFRDRIRNFAASAVNAFKSAFGISSPSKVMATEVGRWLPPGIARGMDQSIGAVEAARDRMIAAAVPDVSDSYALRIAPVADPYAGGAAAVAAPAGGGQQVTVAWVGDAPGSFTRWVKDNVRVYHGGDANAAFGRAPTPQLAAGR